VSHGRAKLLATCKTASVHVRACVRACTRVCSRTFARVLVHGCVLVCVLVCVSAVSTTGGRCRRGRSVDTLKVRSNSRPILPHFTYV
jgi:hypothetical protein